MKGGKKGQMNISFGLIFAIVAGAFILILAIYAVTKFTSIENKAQEGEVGKTLASLTNPLESSFESSQTVTITTSVETRIYTGCYFDKVEYDPQVNQGRYFGKQLINTSQETYGKWTETTMNLAFSNKYIFSKNPTQGRKFYVFSKHFDSPFKVGDLIYLISQDEEYCFVDADGIRNGKLKNDIENLNQPTLLIPPTMGDCPEESIKVCFKNRIGCDIKIDYTDGYVSKNNQKLYFEGDALMFAAILSDKETYECQIQRLIQRAKTLSEIYSQKYDLMIEELGCDSNLKTDLIILENLFENYKDSSELRTINAAAENLQKTNEKGSGDCRVW